MAGIRGQHKLITYGRVGLLSLPKRWGISLIDIDWSADLSTFRFERNVYVPVVPELKRHEGRIRCAKYLHRLGKKINEALGIKVLEIEFDVL